MIGETVAHYRVLDKLGGGGMGEVYLAEDTRLHRRVALKVLPALMASDPEHLERFAREAKALAGLNHPNIVTVYSVEEAGDQRLLVMELIEGRTLADLIPEGGLPEDRFFELAIPLADALSAAHARGVTHRDLKPSNVMVTEDGRVKVVDFGLAKLRQEAEARERTVVLEEDLTEEGRILGTYPYMSPEQIKGKPVDQRSDIFSLGVVLYEMATGGRPFIGETSADLISSILRDSPPPAHESNRELPRHLDRILSHCLEKDPDARFQTAKDLRNELRSLRQELQSERLLRSTSITRRLVSTGSAGRRLRGTVVGAALLAAVSFGAAIWLWPRGDRDAAREAASVATAGPAATSSTATRQRPSVAVLYFQNLTGNPDLEWLRTGLTEMLVTDLSQSPELRVVGTDQLYQVLKELDALDQPVLSADVIRKIADRANVGTVLLGSFVEAGGTLQVNLTLKDPRSGDIVSARRAQGAGESSIFSIVDRLSSGVFNVFESSGRIAGDRRQDLERAVTEVTTSSVEAFRLYSEGMRLSHAVKLDEAIPLFQSAVQLDPGFAMAYARLARIYNTLGREDDLAKAVDLAIEYADRLPPRERYYVEGVYYGRKRETYAIAVDKLEKVVELYPDHHLARYQLGLIYSYLELFDRAADEFRELLRRGYDYDGVYNSLASVYTALGRPDEAKKVLLPWVADHPDRWSAHLILGWHEVNWGAPEEALEALEKAEALRPGSPFVRFLRWRAETLSGNWSQADAVAQHMAQGSDPYWRWRGLTAQAILALYGGHPELALDRLETAGRVYDHAEPQVGTSQNLEARTLLRLGRPAEASEAAKTARRVAPGEWPAWEGLFWGALAEQQIGHRGEADRLAQSLGDLEDLLPGSVEERYYHRLLGLLADSRGQADVALKELGEAQSLLPARGLEWHRHRLPDHAALWFELAELDRRQGRAEEAEAWYRRVVESGEEHTYYPIEYVRSHYYLARLLEERGDREGARANYRRFLDFWGSGTIDRDLVTDARKRLADLV